MTSFTGRLVFTVIDWLPLLPHVNDRLRQEPAARVADLACGDGWFGLSLARDYPLVRVDGWDDDDGCVAHARRTAVAVEVDDRVQFEVGPPRGARPGSYDLVTASTAPERGCEPRLLRAAGRLVRPDTGVVVVADPRPASTVVAAARQSGFADADRLPADGALVGVYVLAGWQNPGP